MENKFIMTAFGKNRPGIVAEIAEIIYANKCNLEDSNMGRLADEFTLILLLAGKGDDLAEKLSRDCKRLEREKNISVFIRPLEYQQLESENKNHLHSIEVEGIDQAGIVYKISRVLADAGINIETLISHKKPIPQSGTDMYSMKINIKIPETISFENIEDQLENIANDLNVDITLK
jgi:glycine cleavage system transcriptional repressor